ncbi:hypothetical protein ACNI3T_00425 [Christiangramia sp. ASW11-125]|uniref:hypothetical protein n=1 Tax=Christiangramia sp. ASW11-125 TaxID=3400701 RepID=UPI003AAD7CED
MAKHIKQQKLKIVLISIFSLFAIISFPLIVTDLRANVWIYEYFLAPIFISSIAIGILIFLMTLIHRKYQNRIIILIGLIAFAVNFFWNFVLSFAVGWGGGDYNIPYKNEPILKYKKLEIVEHQQSSEISHYMLNRTYLSGLIYKQIGFETRNNSVCEMTFSLIDEKEKYEFDKCSSTLRKVQ